MTTPYGSGPPGQPVPPPDTPAWTPPAYPAPHSSPDTGAPGTGAPGTGAPGVPGTGPAQPPLTGFVVPSSQSGAYWPTAPRAPGTVTAAAVITYIQAGLGALAVLTLLGIGSLATGFHLTAYFVALTVVGVTVSVLSIVAALQLQRGRSRAFLLWLTIVTIAMDVVSTIVDVAHGSAAAMGAGPSLCSLILPTIVLILLLQPATTEWIEMHRQMPGR